MSDRLLVLLPGLGAVASTFVAGVELARQGLAAPVGALTQLGATRRGALPALAPLASLQDLTFGAWDIVAGDAAAAADRAGVLREAHLRAARPFLATVRARPGVHDPELVRRIRADQVIPARGHRRAVAALHADIDDMMSATGASRAVLVYTASTEAWRPPAAFASQLDLLERALDADDPQVTPAMLYAYAAITRGIPFANATPNACVDLPAFHALAEEHRAPIAGRDLKSGQTWLKSAIAPAIAARALGLSGWFSTNLLGNRDGEVLDDPEAFRAKEDTKSAVLEAILDPRAQPELYGRYTHKVAIHFYPPRGDDKEGWDAIDLFGWLGYPMQIKVDLLGRDSVLAAPMVLDLALLLDLAQRAGRRGVQDWLSFYFKAPLAGPGRAPEHDLFAQHAALVDAWRHLGTELTCRSTR